TRPGAEELRVRDEVLRKICEHPQSTEKWDGMPYCWWSSYLWDPPINYLRRLNIPIFMAHGVNDETLPVESARAVAEDFNKFPKANLTYKEYPVNHDFRDKRGINVFPSLTVDILKWLNNLNVIATDRLMAFEHKVRSARLQPNY
ncbi:MAG: hypothetical protein PHV82_06015, partial [Victivallaceae bacterium]|nr:hypothetical protein [Victivallaceae bacterium]